MTFSLHSFIRICADLRCRLLPPCFPDFTRDLGEAGKPYRATLKYLTLLKRNGAGEGIRTLDPNLGKVVLYP